LPDHGERPHERGTIQRVIARQSRVRDEILGIRVPVARNHFQLAGFC
jgi:hypothetical protein